MEQFSIGEEVELSGNPLDEQLNQFIPLGIKTIIDVKDVRHAGRRFIKIKRI